MKFTNLIKHTIKTENLDGFTKAINGDLQNYVVAFTDNAKYDLNLLNDQYNARPTKTNLTIGGRKDNKTGKLYIDLGFTVKSLREAVVLGNCYNQKAIRDNANCQEIRLIA